jgi:hypothetical protein
MPASGVDIGRWFRKANRKLVADILKCNPKVFLEGNIIVN